MNTVTNSLGYLATEVTTYAIRTTIALGIPTYLALRIHPSTSLKTPGNKLLTASLVD